ncbi:hypothetical protein N7532_006736 [Penicillium argentinense]|uniref:Uncharacterized protein n=1 Tax=Penicillium argentinense TaxID=1131581 RepID=A0A9W9KB40_9EURO|nr:uncharacterized protein N7532_006736 [Penicillium argentinense]KAJ5099735.1 hypothetical protein N7532_006736 [Penicillium argentinense]
MVLLTSSTVSTIVSMGVVCIFTLLLFLSGYVLQQQSVKNIQHAIRPPLEPATRSREALGSAFQKRGLSDSDLDAGVDQESSLGSQDRHAKPRGNFAYLQLLSEPDPSDICSAVLFFKQLATNGTRVQDRLFMYPQEWDRMSTKKLGKPASIALSILRAASIKYGIWLLPIDMTAATSAGYSTTNTKLLRLGQIQFMQYDSVLYVQTPGMILDTERLDDVLFSRPLPLRHDKNRPESFNNEAWIPMPLRAERDADLPPVYLITVNNIRGASIETRTHIPNIHLPGFGGLVTGPWGVKPESDDGEPIQQPAYVYFSNDRDGHVKWAGNPLFGTWRSQQSEVCDGLELDAFYHDEMK